MIKPTSAQKSTWGLVHSRPSSSRWTDDERVESNLEERRTEMGMRRWGGGDGQAWKTDEEGLEEGRGQVGWEAAPEDGWVRG